jgi:hypothetical protein
MKNLKNYYNFEDLEDGDIEEVYWEELNKQGRSTSTNFIPFKGKQSHVRTIREDDYLD